MSKIIISYISDYKMLCLVAILVAFVSTATSRVTWVTLNYDDFFKAAKGKLNI